MSKSKAIKNVTVRTAEDLGRALGLSAADTAEMEIRSEVTDALAKIIQAGRLTHAEIAKKSRHIENAGDRDCEWKHARRLSGCAHSSARRDRSSRRGPGEKSRGLV